MRIVILNGRSFLALHCAALLGVVAIAAMLVTGRFADRRAVAAEQAEDLNRITAAKLRAATLARRIAGRGDPFLAATDERLGSADLQAILQEIARQKGATLLGVQGLPSPRGAGLKLVSAKLEIEGSLDQLEGVVQAVEDHVPILWIDAAAMKDTGAGQELGATLHAELQVQAALAATPPRPAADTGGGAPLGGAKP